MAHSNHLYDETDKKWVRAHENDRDLVIFTVLPYVILEKIRKPEIWYYRYVDLRMLMQVGSYLMKGG